MTVAAAFSAYYQDPEPPLASTLSNRQLAFLSDTSQRELSEASLTLMELEKKTEFVESNIWKITLSSTPFWFSKVVDSLNLLLGLEENWDSYGARNVSLETAHAAIVLLYSVMGDQTPIPSIVPVPSGNVQLEWHRSGIDLEVEITPSRRYSIFYQDENETSEDESPIHSVHFPEVLSNYVERVTQRAGYQE